MSWRASEWVWDHSKAIGIPKYVFLCVARRVFKDKSETGPTPLELIVEKTGMSESTVIRSISALQTLGELKVLKVGRRKGTVHRYALNMQPNLVGLSEPSAPADAHLSQRQLRAVTQPSEASTVSALREPTVDRQPGGCEQSDSQVSPVTGTAPYVPRSSEVRTEQVPERTGRSAAATPQSHAQKANDNGNYRVIERLALQLLEERGGVSGFDDGEPGFREALKWACAERRIDYGRQVNPDVILRAATSAVQMFAYRVIERLALQLLEVRGGISGFDDGEAGFREALKAASAAERRIGAGSWVNPDVVFRAAASAMAKFNIGWKSEAAS